MKDPNECSTIRSSGSKHKRVSAPYFNPFAYAGAIGATEDSYPLLHSTASLSPLTHK